MAGNWPLMLAPHTPIQHSDVPFMYSNFPVAAGSRKAVWHAPTCFFEGSEIKIRRCGCSLSAFSQFSDFEKPSNSRKCRFTLGSVMLEIKCRTGVWERWRYIKTCIKCGAGKVRAGLSTLRWAFAQNQEKMEIRPCGCYDHLFSFLLEIVMGQGGQG